MTYNLKIFRFRFGTAYKNSINDTMILMTKKKIYKNRQKGKVTNLTQIKYELSVQLQYEQKYAERGWILEDFKSLIYKPRFIQGENMFLVLFLHSLHNHLKVYP